jgi:hypothetical protein
MDEAYNMRHNATEELLSLFEYSSKIRAKEVGMLDVGEVFSKATKVRGDAKIRFLAQARTALGEPWELPEADENKVPF